LKYNCNYSIFYYAKEAFQILEISLIFVKLV
jgi:hypothetical protein